MRSPRRLRLSLAAVMALVFCPVPLSGQGTGDVAERFWVYLSDKAPITERSRDETASARALERRARRGDPAAARMAAPVPKDYVEALREAGAEVVVESAWLNAVSARLTPEIRRQVEALPFVRAVTKLGRARGALPRPEDDQKQWPEALGYSRAEDPLYGPSLKQLEIVNAVRVLDQGLNGTGVRLGFLDTEYDFTHPAFSNLVNEGRLLAVRNFTGESQSNRHGQYVTSVAIGYDPGRLLGPCSGAEVLAATTEVAFYERNVEEDHFVAGMEWLEREGADIVSVSLGYDVFDLGERSYAPQEMDGRTAIPSLAAAAAARLGVVVVVAAGNGGTRGATSIGSPADADTIITVGGVNPDSTKYALSSLGPTADGRIKPDVAAQATGVYFAAGTQGGYSSGGGTSFSTPMVAGIVCQILQANPDLTPVQVRTLLHSTSHRATSPDNLLGWGIVNAEAAVGAALTLAAEPGDHSQPRAPGLQVFPQPADRTVTILFADETLPPAGSRIGFYDVLGRSVLTVPAAAGAGSVRTDISFLPDGIYLLRLLVPSGMRSGRLVVAR